ncbi:MAG: succinate dehydrogenase iron-sulfur subunit [Thermincola sp.]|jgi:succinate dehydrogenase / fumarate reductase iron-sulfur subunit|nr:succinate dehydrogenase iron-sulfur subunit [Thermincola sp.]MDT3704603.1 succinate dehydrogenase iron-sulfur subunit [Thermincola sp.]
MPEFIHLRIRRQADPKEHPRWEEFKLSYKPNMNVVSVLMEIRKNPVNVQGHKTTPVVWDCSCLEQVCGACTMVINGKVRQACSALIDQMDQSIITLEPLSKFPVVKDLKVDRSILFEHLKKVKAWIKIDGTFDLGPGPRVPEKKRRWMYDISRCMTCGCCYQACPNFNAKSSFIGPAPLAQVLRFNSHPTGALSKEERLESIMGYGGIADCGNAQNCVEACPKNIPLTTSIARLNRDTTMQGIRNWFTK